MPHFHPHQKDKQIILDKFNKLLNSQGYLLIMNPLRYLNFNEENPLIQLSNELTQQTMVSCNKTDKFKVIYYGIILKGELCYLLQKV